MIVHGDCLIEMSKMEENTIDFIVTDPPYGLKFMGKEWDHGVPGVPFWEQALRICKPGSMLAAFGGSRTHHRLMVALEDAGWEIRDVIMYMYGTGFPKSHNHYGLEGYGTALKPAYEPIIIAMKPLDGTYKQNVEKWGLGGINIEDCRIGKPEDKRSAGTRKYKSGTLAGGLNGQGELQLAPHDGKARWPANIILDEEAAEQLDLFTGILKSGSITPNHKTKGKSTIGTFKIRPRENQDFKGDSGGASRFFYCAKASPKERQGSQHPTIKPKKLISYIVKLLAPPNNPICLDPFMGSGTCGVVCKELNIRFVGIELNKEYFEDAKKRIDLADVPQ